MPERSRPGRSGQGRERHLPRLSLPSADEVFRPPVGCQWQVVTDSATGHSDQRGLLPDAGDGEHVAHQGVVVAAVEALVLQPLDRAEETDVSGDRFTVGADQVDLGIVPPVPPSADRLGLRPLLVGQQAQQAGPHEGLDGPSAPARPGAFDALE